MSKFSISPNMTLTFGNLTSIFRWPQASFSGIQELDVVKDVSVVFNINKSIFAIAEIIEL